MFVRDIMTHEVECVQPETTLQQAALKMRSNDVGSLPVCEGEKLLGIITDRDIVVRAIAEGRDANQACVRDAMSEDLVCCCDDQHVGAAADLMRERQIRRLPVLNRDGRLVGIVALALLVGGIVIMNIMLMVVSERTREIGLRKALGAKRRDIMSQVLTESITLSTFGGVVGILLGFTFAMLLAAVTPLPATLELWSVVLGVGITAAVGLFFGAYPAARAAALDPIEALRRE